MSWTDAAWRYLRDCPARGANSDLTLLALCHLADVAGSAGQGPWAVTTWVVDLTGFAASTTTRHLAGWVAAGVVERDAVPGQRTQWRPGRQLRSAVAS